MGSALIGHHCDTVWNVLPEAETTWLTDNISLEPLIPVLCELRVLWRFNLEFFLLHSNSSAPHWSATWAWLYLQHELSLLKLRSHWTCKQRMKSSSEELHWGFSYFFYVCPQGSWNAFVTGFQVMMSKLGNVEGTDDCWITKARVWKLTMLRLSFSTRSLDMIVSPASSLQTIHIWHCYPKSVETSWGIPLKTLWYTERERNVSRCGRGRSWQHQHQMRASCW